jgi:iron complex transport system permease protein
MNKRALVNIILFTIIFVVMVLIYLRYDAASVHIIRAIRLPRLVLTFVCGFVLAGVGYTFQVLLDNPLAEPYILGISSGAAMGSIVASVLGLFLLMPLFGFAGALLSMILVWTLAHIGGYFSRTKLILSGIIIGLFFSSFISLLMYFNQKDIGHIINVLMGNLGYIFSHSEWNFFLILIFFIILIMIYLFFQAIRLQVLSTGDMVAHSLGLNVPALRKRLFILCSLLTGIVVSYAGIIGFIGLIVPHSVRFLQRGNQRINIVLSSFAGGIFLLFCDFLAMHLAVIEIPVGIITAFLGSPFFILLMLRNK